MDRLEPIIERRVTGMTFDAYGAPTPATTRYIIGHGQQLARARLATIDGERHLRRLAELAGAALVVKPHGELQGRPPTVRPPTVNTIPSAPRSGVMTSAVSTNDLLSTGGQAPSGTATWPGW